LWQSVVIVLLRGCDSLLLLSCFVVETDISYSSFEWLRQSVVIVLLSGCDSMLLLSCWVVETGCCFCPVAWLWQSVVIVLLRGCDSLLLLSCCVVVTVCCYCPVAWLWQSVVIVLLRRFDSHNHATLGFIVFEFGFRLARLSVLLDKHFCSCTEIFSLRFMACVMIHLQEVKGV
jgi:hypothetical protein